MTGSQTTKMKKEIEKELNRLIREVRKITKTEYPLLPLVVNGRESMEEAVIRLIRKEIKRIKKTV